MLPNGTNFSISKALYSTNFKYNLLNFKDIYLYEYDVQSAIEDGKKYMYVLLIKMAKGIYGKKS